MALKRLQYVINASLSPVSKFIEHYENAILGDVRRVRLASRKTLDMHRTVGMYSLFHFVSVYQSES